MFPFKLLLATAAKVLPFCVSVLCVAYAGNRDQLLTERINHRLSGKLLSKL